ncbi:mechanosensitive ion channel domain-containing protein [Halobellus captivus]|uniref:mechanosensitive ion channel domain-containing protein n=1 Tax=Halobellus captivus TaxID=2592614 RepID=UPI0011A3DFAA|nr:mechanosensitive ion channel domain-containing protein [Halobellus captivus]
MPTVGEFLGNTIQRTVNEFAGGIQEAAPKLLTGIVFLALAYVSIRVVTRVLRGTLAALYSEEQGLVVDLGVTVVAVFLWFGAALALLNILGMGEIAASLGTAAGFVALGVSYALSNMIADTVAGVYLLRDPDFNPGDEVKSDPVTGVVTAIELRKTRFRDEEGRTVVVANRDVEKKWTQIADGDAESGSDVDPDDTGSNTDVSTPETEGNNTDATDTA